MNRQTGSVDEVPRKFTESEGHRRVAVAGNRQTRRKEDIQISSER